MSKRIWTLFSEVHEEGMCWVDDNDPVVLETFLGAYDEADKAQAFADAVKEHERLEANKELAELDDGESDYPAAPLSWTAGTFADGARKQLTSDTYEFLFGATKFVIRESYMNPVLR